jgi:hypothetical protein
VPDSPVAPGADAPEADEAEEVEPDADVAGAVVGGAVDAGDVDVLGGADDMPLWSVAVVEVTIRLVVLSAAACADGRPPFDGFEVRMNPTAAAAPATTMMVTASERRARLDRRRSAPPVPDTCPSIG